MKYSASILTSPRQIKLQTTESAPLQRGEIRARVLQAGICGTDLALYHGDYPVPLPLTLGHEWVGEIEEVADDSKSDWIGKRVVAEINNSCRAWQSDDPCEACRRNLDTHCLRRTVTGIIRHDGAFAEYITAPVGNVHVLPDTFPTEQAVLIEPLAAALQTFEMSPVRGDEKVLLLGCGRLGILIAIVAAKIGLDITAVARHSDRLALAEEFGIATYRLESADTLEADMKSATHGLGMDMVIDATGSSEGLPLALRCVRPRGSVALKSTPGLPIQNFPLTQTVVDEVCLQGSRCGNFKQAIDFHLEHKLDLSAILRNRFSLKQIDKAMECATREAGKTVLTIGDPV